MKLNNLKRILYYSTNTTYKRKFFHSESILRSKDLLLSKLQSTYSSAEEKEIISTLNSLSETDTEKFFIQKSVMRKLLDERSTKGNFENLSDILHIRGIGKNTLESICNVIINKPNSPTQSSPKPKKQVGQILNPQLSPSAIENIESACGLFVNLNLIAWAEVTKNNELNNWGILNFNLQDETKIESEQIMENVWCACKDMPRSSVYIIEALPKVLRSSGGDANNPKTVYINLQKAQLHAMLSASLNTLRNIEMNSKFSNEVLTEDSSDFPNYNKPFSHKVYYLRNAMSSRLFKTFIGNEKVSSQSVVENIINKRTDELPFLSNFAISEDLKEQYFNHDAISKEILCQALLLTVTFMELCIHHNKNAYSALRSQNA